MPKNENFLSGKSDPRLYYDIQKELGKRPRGYMKYIQKYYFTMYAALEPEVSIALYLTPEKVRGDVFVTTNQARLLVRFIEGSFQTVDEDRGRGYAQAVVDDLWGLRPYSMVNDTAILPCAGDVIDVAYEKGWPQNQHERLEGRIMSAIGQETGWIFREFVTGPQFM